MGKVEKGLPPPSLSMILKPRYPNCRLNSCRFRHRRNFTRGRHRYHALSLSRWGMTRSRVVLSNHWQMARKKIDETFRSQHSPTKWRGNIRNGEKFRWYEHRFWEEKARWSHNGNRCLNSLAGTRLKEPGQLYLELQQTGVDAFPLVDGTRISE